MQRQLWKGLFRTTRAFNNNSTSGKYFNKGVKALDDPDLGHVVRETPDKIVVFGGKNERYDTFLRLKKNTRLVVKNHCLQVVKILGQKKMAW